MLQVEVFPIARHIDCQSMAAIHDVDYEIVGNGEGDGVGGEREAVQSLNSQGGGVPRSLTELHPAHAPVAEEATCH